MLDNIDISTLISNYILPFGLKLITAIAVYIIGKMIINILIKVITTVLSKSKMDEMLLNFVVSIIRSVLLLFVIIAALDQLGVDTTSFIALLGAAGLAVGLALQSTLQNFASGVMLIIFRPFTKGDFIEAAGISGKVDTISIFNTVILTGDNKQIIVPNGDIYGGTITNYSANDTRRIDMVFGIGYDDDMKQAKQIMQDVIAADERVLADPATLIAVSELADSSVNFVVRPWVKTADYWAVKFDLTEGIKEAFDKNGISIPYPQMDVHQHQGQA